MRFEPKSREQFQNERLIPKKTICDAEVIRAEEKTSKAGNPMIAILLKVYHEANSVLINDWLVAGSQKLLNFCDLAGIGDAYMRGEVTAELVNGRAVTVKVGIEEQDDYPPKNKVIDYVAPKATSKPVANPESVKGLGVSDVQRRNAMASKAAAPPDDEIPFNMSWLIIGLSISLAGWLGA
jgi:hypothetical protein